MGLGQQTMSTGAQLDSPSGSHEVRTPGVEARGLIEAILNHTHMLVACLDRDFSFLLVNAAYARADERDPSFFPGKNHFDLYPDEENQAVFRGVVETGQPHYAHAKAFSYAQHPERGVTYWDWSLIPVLDQSGAVAWLVLTLVDVSARERAQLAQRESEQQLRQALDKLQEAKEDLARANRNLEEVVFERTARLRQTIADLEQFSYSIAHDLRAPLRAMTSFSMLLIEESGHKLDEQSQDYLRRITSAAMRMDDLIHDVLTYSRMIRTEMVLVPVELDKLVRDIVQQYPSFHPERADISIKRPLLTVAGNTASLTQCISNLLGNAVKFVAPGAKPQVRVWSEEHDGWARLYVEDNGIGIDESHRERIWRIFERLHDQSTYEGTGIGLSIVKRAIERMGGTVGVESALGKGSTFWFQLANAS
jgi:signal transduction histidine kinase